jgi:hypothetical protein
MARDKFRNGYNVMMVRVESEVSSHEGESLPGPNPCVRSLGNGVVPNASLKTGLCIFGYSGTGEEAQPGPVIDRMFNCQKSIICITDRANGMSQGVKHVDGIGLFLFLGLRPGRPLGELLSDIWMHVDPLLLERSWVRSNTRLIRQECHAMCGCVNVVAKALLTKRTLACRGERVAVLDPVKIGTDQSDGDAVGNGSSRLLVIPAASEPSGEVTNSRVNSRVVRLTYVASVSPQEISLAKLDSSSRGRRHT